MLRIIFGETEGAMHVPSWFRFNYEEEWFEDPLVAEIMADVDKLCYKVNFGATQAKTHRLACGMKPFSILTKT